VGGERVVALNADWLAQMTARWKMFKNSG